MEKDNKTVTRTEIRHFENILSEKRAGLSVNIDLYGKTKDPHMKSELIGSIMENMEDVLRSAKELEKLKKQTVEEPRRDEKITRTVNPDKPYDNGTPETGKDGLIFKRDTGLKEQNEYEETIGNLADATLTAIDRFKKETSGEQKLDLFRGCVKVYEQIEQRRTELLRFSQERAERLSGGTRSKPSAERPKTKSDEHDRS